MAYPRPNAVSVRLSTAINPSQSFVIQGPEDNIPERKYLVRMPAKRGYPHRLLYTQLRDLFPKAKYDFIREGHSYFGKVKQVRIFDTDVYAYIYVDHYNALKGYTEFVTKKPDEFERLSNREKDWYKVKNGYKNAAKNPHACVWDESRF